MQDIDQSTVFNFEEEFPNLMAESMFIANPYVATEAAPNKSCSFDVEQSLAAAGEAAYHWDITTDQILWSANASQVLGCSIDSLATGRHYANLLDIDNSTTRYETVMYSKSRDHGQGVSFQIEYNFRAQGRKDAKSIRLEDSGRWQGGSDGAPKHVQGTVRRIDERYNRDQHLGLLGITDPKTGMMNRGRMTAVLSETINAIKDGSNCAFVIASINDLNLVNDAYGFAVADEVIVAVGQRLRQVMRAGDSIARYSGSKFGIILNECSDKDLQVALTRFAASVRDSIIETSHGPTWSTISIGAALLPETAETAEIAISRAEEALSDAMQNPNGDFIVYQQSEQRQADRAFNRQCGINLATRLKENSFRLAYQPIVSATSHLPVMHEALLRVADGQSENMLQAAHLIPLAERLGLIRLVDRSVMELIVQELNTFPELNLSMNIARATVVDHHWNEQLIDILKSNNAVAQRLTVEICEDAVSGDLKSTHRFMQRVREAGASVAIDQFGRNTASLRHLQELPINSLKLHGALCNDASNEYLVRTLLDVAKKGGVKTVTEWVETQQTAEKFKAWGADYLQGHYFGSPVLNPACRDNESIAIVTETHAPVVCAQFETAPLDVQAEAVVETAPESDNVPALETIEHIDSAEPILDFSAIDDSIAKLRQALDGLNSISAHSEPSTQVA